MPLTGLAHMLLAGGAAFGVTLLLTPVVRAFAVRSGQVSRPVADRWGRRAVARLGGVALFTGIAASAAAALPMGGTLAGLLAALGLAFLLGLVDDLRRLAPHTKLIGQLLIGCLVVFAGIRIELVQWSWLSIPLSVLWLVFVMNAFNLLDNMDGLAAGIGALAAAFCAWHGALSGQWPIAVLGAVVCGSCLGFLSWNFPPAKIYMGDSGSHVLGLALAALALWGSWRHSSQLAGILAVPTLVLAVPIFDTCFVTLQRLAHRRHPFVGGQDHVSHRLAVLGLSTRQTVVALYAASACLGALSIVTLALRPLAVLVMSALVLAGVLVFGGYLARVRVYRLESAAQAAWVRARGAPVTVVETMLLHKRRLLEILVDFVLVSAGLAGAHLLRFEGVLDPALQRLLVQALPVVLLVKFACFAAFGLYRGMWRYVGLVDLLGVLKAVTAGSVLSALALLLLWRFEGYSRAVFIIDWMMTFFLVGGSRVLQRLLDEWIASAAPAVPALVVGAGATGERVLRSLRGDRGGLRVVGLVDDDPTKAGARLHGVPVVGTRHALAALLELHAVESVLVAITDPPGELLQYVRTCCEPRGVAWKVVTAGVTDAV